MNTTDQTDLIREQHDKIAALDAKLMRSDVALEHYIEHVVRLDRDWHLMAQAIQHMEYSGHWPLDRRQDCAGCMTVETARGLAKSRTRGGDEE